MKKYDIDRKESNKVKKKKICRLCYFLIETMDRTIITDNKVAKEMIRKPVTFVTFSIYSLM